MKESGTWKGATKGNGNVVQTNRVLFLGKTNSVALNVP